MITATWKSGTGGRIDESRPNRLGRAGYQDNLESGYHRTCTPQNALPTTSCFPIP